MLEIQSKLTSQGQVSVPASVRAALGVQPGAFIRWTIEGGKVSVQREARYTNEDLRAALFGDEVLVEPKTLEQLKDGIAQYIRQKHGRR
jgi:antitoxin PrlF